MHREIQEKAESCPCCRAAGKNSTTQIPSTEKTNLEILTEPNQENQLDYAGSIKSMTHGDVYILVYGEMADYLVLNEARKRGRSVSRDFKKYHFFKRKTNQIQ